MSQVTEHVSGWNVHRPTQRDRESVKSRTRRHHSDTKAENPGDELPYWNWVRSDPIADAGPGPSRTDEPNVDHARSASWQIRNSGSA
jgi:hypothetical protein